MTVNLTNKSPQEISEINWLNSKELIDLTFSKCDNWKTFINILSNYQLKNIISVQRPSVPVAKSCHTRPSLGGSGNWSIAVSLKTVLLLFATFCRIFMASSFLFLLRSHRHDSGINLKWERHLTIVLTVCKLAYRFIICKSNRSMTLSSDKTTVKRYINNYVPFFK